jgi:hypothetical protein
MYIAAANMPMWQLHDRRCVFIQHGTFLPPLDPPPSDNAAGSGGARMPPPAAAEAAGQAAQAHAVSGLGDEARAFIMQHLPLFKVRAGVGDGGSAFAVGCAVA